MDEMACTHLQAFGEVKKSKTHECEECVKKGSEWVHLRVCQTCGVTLCCDSSPNKHASKHAAASGHPVFTSAEKGERWAWCYVDQQFLDY
jgi:hypothetical protein